MPGLLRGVARTAVVAGTATAVSNRVSRRQAGRWAQQDAQQQQAQQEYAQQPTQQGYAQQPAAAAPAAPPSTDDEMTSKIDQLKELGELKAQGVLTEEEFAAQKRRVLG
ncbi:SHOCT domain-containing protein [Streptomyces anandii]|jgi:hemolysin activation/secretion protein|uniref:SHOCT domain-containing protein n=1 Tax=Streptomyces anandii TaxID=285454 RepID=A0ABW6H8E2_9ACTN